MKGELVHLSVRGSRATITLDSQHNRNALSRQLRSELMERLEIALGDTRTRVVVLTHRGPVFCSGADLKEASDDDLDESSVGFPAILERIWHAPKPVIASVSGTARAGGLGLIAACDIAIASDIAEFALSEVRIGVVPAVISAVILPRTDPAAAHELFLTGELFDARRAAEIGLINRAVAPEGVDAEVERYGAMLARGGPRAIAGTKQLLRATHDRPLESELARLAELSETYFRSAEAAEGMRAFLEKRPPSWVADQMTTP